MYRCETCNLFPLFCNIKKNHWPLSAIIYHILNSIKIKNKLPTRKPGTALMTEYFTEKYDLPGSYVIWDRYTDVELAKKLGCKAIFISADVEILCC